MFFIACVSYLSQGYGSVFFIYYFFWLFISVLPEKALSAGAKFLLIIPVVGIHLGYIEWIEYSSNKEWMEARKELKSKLRTALPDLPEGAEFGEYNDRLYATTDNLKDKQGDQPTFKWGKYELTSFKSETQNSVNSVKVVSLTLPDDLPKWIKCSSTLYFERKIKPQDENNVAAADEFEFSGCKANDFSFNLAGKKVTFDNFTISYNPYSQEDKIFDLIKKATKLDMSSPYWQATLDSQDGYIKIGKEWEINREFSIILNQKGEPVMLLGKGTHINGLSNTRIRENCMINNHDFTAALTNIQSKKATLNIFPSLSEGDFSESCPKKINVTLTYFDIPSIHLLAKENKVKDMNNSQVLKIFTDLDDNMAVYWIPSILNLDAVKGLGKAFYWGDVKITDFNGYRNKVSVNLADEIKFHAFQCNKNTGAEFTHLLDPKDNSLAYYNFFLSECDEAEGDMQLEGNLLKLGVGSLEYFNAKEYASKLIDEDKLLIFKPKEYKQVLLNIDDLRLYVGYVLTDYKGNIKMLIGAIYDPPTRERMLGECHYHFHYNNLKLTNFSENEADISVISDEFKRKSEPECQYKRASYNLLN